MEFTSRKLRAFHLAAQQRSFTKDAESLFITPSGLSVVIREQKKINSDSACLIAQRAGSR